MSKEAVINKFWSFYNKLKDISFLEEIVDLEFLFRFKVIGTDMFISPEDYGWEVYWWEGSGDIITLEEAFEMIPSKYKVELIYNFDLFIELDEFIN